MVNSKKMNKSTVAIVVLSLLLVLSLVLSATGAWFTNSAKTDGSTAPNNFGTVKVGLTGVNQAGTWENTVDRDETKVLPGSTLKIAENAQITNTSNVKTYAVVKVGDIAVKMQAGSEAEKTLSADEIKALFNLTSLALTVTPEAGVTTATGFEAYNETVYILPAVEAETKVFSIANLTLTVNKKATNETTPGTLAADNELAITDADHITIPNGTTITVSYSIEVKLVQVANTETADVVTALGLTTKQA